MLMWAFVLVACSATATLGWILGCEWMQRQATIPAYLPSTAYADDFADHLSGRIYDRELPPSITGQWEQYRDAS